MFGLGGKPTFCVWHFSLFLFFFLHVFVGLQLLFMHCTWTVAAKFDFFSIFLVNQDTSCTVYGYTNFTFQQFFIKNRSHSTIHTFKNYFATVFFKFQFQFSTVSKWNLSMIIFYFDLNSQVKIFIVTLLEKRSSKFPKRKGMDPLSWPSLASVKTNFSFHLS